MTLQLFSRKIPKNLQERENSCVGLITVFGLKHRINNLDPEKLTQKATPTSLKLIFSIIDKITFIR